MCSKPSVEPLQRCTGTLGSSQPFCRLRTSAWASTVLACVSPGQNLSGCQASRALQAAAPQCRPSAAACAKLLDPPAADPGQPQPRTQEHSTQHHGHLPHSAARNASSGVVSMARRAGGHLPQPLLHGVRGDSRVYPSSDTPMCVRGSPCSSASAALQ